jgi:hypothetical protein
MKVLTYKNPLDLSKTIFMEKYGKYPHICASQTLVQGLEKYYGDKTDQNFNLITTVNDLSEKLYPGWHNNVENDIKIKNIISNFIEDKIDNDDKKRIYRSNRNEIFSTIKYIYESNLKLNKLKKFKDIDCDYLYKICEEVNKNYYNGKINLFEEINFDLLDKVYSDIKKEKIENLNEKSKESDYKELYEIKINKIKKSEIDKKKIIIHGVYRITPVIKAIIDSFEDNNIEVIIMINYNKNYKEIYKFWKIIYEKIFLIEFSTDAEELKSRIASKERPLGTSYANLMDGK